MCEVSEDCYDLISHLNLRDSFRSDLELTCTSDGICRSTYGGLWTDGTITGEEFCKQELLFLNVFKTNVIKSTMSIKRYAFPSFCPTLADCVRCKTGPTVEKCDTDWNIRQVPASARGSRPRTVSNLGAITDVDHSQCFCPKASNQLQCPPER